MNEIPQAVYRILDASSNRAGEALRTLEEYARFALDDVDLSGKIKSQRHSLTKQMLRLDRQKLLAARDTPGDVGVNIETDFEYLRADVHDVIAAAGVRVAQSLRCLEEYGKILDPEFARNIEAIRYRCYTITATLESLSLQQGLAATETAFNDGGSTLDVDGSATTTRKQALKDAMLYVLVECGENQETLLSHCKELAKSGVDVIQLRDKEADDRTLYERAKSLINLLRPLGVLLIINDRVDIAVASGADGVHVGQTELPAAQARRIAGPDRLVGISTHTIEQVHEAIDAGADYIGCGPVFPGQTKSFEDFPGVDFLVRVHQSTQKTPLPAFAIGGIDAENLDAVLEAGFHRIAVTGAIGKAASPSAVAKKLKARLLHSHVQ